MCRGQKGVLGGNQMNKQKKHYPWWGYVRYIIRRYPVLDENYLFQEMCRADSRDWSAVKSAIDHTECTENGLARLKMIRMVHWDRTHTLEGAALSIPCSRSLAAKWQREFFEEVARNRGLLD